MSNVDIADPPFWSKTSGLQLMYGVWVNLTIIGLGLAHAFPAVQLPQLLSPSSDILLTFDQASWIASILILFSPIGCFLSGTMADRFGRRLPIIMCQIPICFGWIYTGIAKKAWDIIIGRAITGVGCGMAMGVPRMYTAEISLVNMRGLLGAFPNIFLAIGFSMQAAFGTFLEWRSLCKIGSIYNGVLFFSYMFVTESPHYLLLHGQVEKARKALAHFRSKKYPIDNEIKVLVDFTRENNIRRLTWSQKSALLMTSSACKPFAISMTYIVFGCASGVQIVATWTIHLLQVTNSSYDSYAGNFLIALTRLFASVIASVLLFHIGRRPVAIISAFVMGATSLGLGVFLKYYTKPSIVPQIIFMIYSGFGIIGYQCMPFLLMSEMYPLQIRGLLMGSSLTLTCLIVFAATKWYPYLYLLLGISDILMTFGAFSVLASVFLCFVLPETKGLTLQEIEEYFKGVRPTLVSDRALIEEQTHSKSSGISRISTILTDENKANK